MPPVDPARLHRLTAALPGRVHLARLPTPIEALTRLQPHPAAPAIDCKRDDLTGLAMSGNKIRKLEFVLAEARRRGATHIVTCGGAQSNHARATAVAAARLGWRCTLLLRSPDGRPLPADGNLLIDRLVGAEVRWVTPGEYEERDAQMAAVADELRARREVPYVVPEGASDAWGAWGYVAMLSELCRQAPALPWRRIVCAVGSGGTYAGLLLGIGLLGLKLRVRGYIVQRTTVYFRRQIEGIIADFEQRFGLAANVDPDWIDLCDRYAGPAYGAVYPQEVETIARVARGTGMLLDPVYTGKAFTGLWHDLAAGSLPAAERVLFLHTGGIHGLWPQRSEFVSNS